MPRTSIRELVEGWRPRYLKAIRKEKSRILDELVAFTGHSGRGRKKRQTWPLTTGRFKATGQTTSSQTASTTLSALALTPSGA